MRTLSVRRLPRAAGGRARGQRPRALKSFDVIVEYSFDDKARYITCTLLLWAVSLNPSRSNWVPILTTVTLVHLRRPGIILEVSV